MSVWYSIQGKFWVRDSQQVRDVLESNTEVWTQGGEREGEVEIVVSYQKTCTLSYVAYIDEMLEEFGSHIVEPVILDWNLDGERGKLYIGPPNTKRAIVSGRTLRQIQPMLSDLTTEDLADLKRML